jgi:hypothetical protein
MQKTGFQKSTASSIQMIGTGRPSLPSENRSVYFEKKVTDPSSCCPKGERYPIPSFFEDRIRPRENEN